MSEQKYIPHVLAGFIGGIIVVFVYACWQVCRSEYLQLDASSAEVWNTQHLVEWDKTGVL